MSFAQNYDIQGRKHFPLRRERNGHVLYNPYFNLGFIMSIELQTISSGYNLSTINDNFQKMEDALNNEILWRKGSVAGEAKMSRDLDMDGNAILNIGINVDSPDSLLTLGTADLRYYNISGDILEGNMDAGQHQIKNLSKATEDSDAVRKKELDEEEAARKAADTSLQNQLNGTSPPMGSAFSTISWHDQVITNSIVIPPNKNAWSFGPSISIAPGQEVTIGNGSFWTIANGKEVN